VVAACKSGGLRLGRWSLQPAANFKHKLNIEHGWRLWLEENLTKKISHEK